RRRHGGSFAGADGDGLGDRRSRAAVVDRGRRRRARAPARIRPGYPDPRSADRGEPMSDIPSAGAPERPGDTWSAGSSVALPSPAIAVDVPLAGQRLQRFLDELASDAPTPGGGAWAGVAAAAGAALIAMVARLTLKKKGYEDVAGRMAAIGEECDEERHILMGLADRDAAAYREVMAAYKLPKETPEQEHTRAFTLQKALQTAP